MKAHQASPLVLTPAEILFLKDIDGKDVCVLGSGDNEVAFALAGLGGYVTSAKSSPLPYPGPASYLAIGNDGREVLHRNTSRPAWAGGMLWWWPCTPPQ
jgi:hypothetical protein